MAIRQARCCGLQGDVEARIRGLFLHSVPTSHPMGTHRYGPFIMLAQNKVVLSFTMSGPRDVSKRPLPECKLCGGLAVLRCETPDGPVSRPCPRAFDPSLPLCDEIAERSRHAPQK